MFCFANIPEVDEEAIMAEEAEETGEVVRRASLLSPHVLLGAFAQFMYVGGQVSVASMFIFYGNEVGHFADSRSSILLSVGQGCFTIGRFLGAFLMKKFRADVLMIIFSSGAIIANVFVVAMKTPDTTYALLVVMFFESIMFPTLFALGTKDLGRNHKRGSAFLVMAVSGGCFLPPIQAVIHDHTNVNISFIMPLIAWCVVLFYGLVGHRWIKYVDEPLTVLDKSSLKNEVFEDDNNVHSNLADTGKEKNVAL
jgi:FHS family L-fucose permease-like MFS transporter